MTKIMTNIIADLIKTGDLSLEDKFIVSEKHGDHQLVIHQCLLW